MRNAKVISLRGRLAGYGGTAANPDGGWDNDPTELEAPGVCRRCGALGTTDFVDLVAERAKMHCPRCWLCWEQEVAEPADEEARARLATRRADAAIRRQRH
jgi:hypothetical protein